MTADSLSWGKVEGGAPGVCRSNEESRASEAQCKLIAIDRATKEEGEAILRIGMGGAYAEAGRDGVASDG